jgi:copper chaperone NosL
VKTVFVLLAVVGALALSIVFFPTAGAHQGPDPILHGKDVCARCRMHIAGPGFAGEMRDREGKLTKYDDLGCLLIAMWRTHREVPEVWVEAHDSNQLVPLLGATLVVDSKIRTPMAYGLIAFEEPRAADEFVREHGGEIRSIEAVLGDGRRFQESQQ